MTRMLSVRRGTLKVLAGVLLGLMALTVVSKPAEAARWYRGRGYGYGRVYRAPRFPVYNRGFGYGPRYYNRGYSGVPVVRPAPFYGGYGYGGLGVPLF